MTKSAGRLGVYHTRCAMRKQRHGNWRQIYYDCDGMCQWREFDDSICGEVDYLEFHAPDGEGNDIEGVAKERVLICRTHHVEVHGDRFVNERGYLPLLQEDIAYEIENLGGLAAWKKHYKIVEKEEDNDKAINSR